MTVTLTVLKSRFREEGTLGKEGRRIGVGELLRKRERNREGGGRGKGVPVKMAGQQALSRCHSWMEFRSF